MYVIFLLWISEETIISLDSINLSAFITEVESVYCAARTGPLNATDPLSSLTLRRLMSYIYGAPILDVSRSHTTTQHSR